MGILSNNFAQIVPGAIISASYVSDIYDVLMGAEREDVMISGSLNITGSIYGTLIGTASIANTASYALFTNYVTVSSSYADNAGTASIALNAITASYAISASYEINYETSSSYAETASIANNAILSETASYVLNAVSSSFTTTAQTASYVEAAQTASYVLNSVSSSFANTASFITTAQTASYVLNAISASFVPGIPSFNFTQSLFVSPTGDDATAVIGDISKPYQSINTARNAAGSGSLIYVLPGTWSYNNTDAVGNPYSGANRNTLFNLWKNGVSYYFSPGAKITVLNETETDDLFLFMPTSSSLYETCNIFGQLEFEGSSIGADTFGGRVGFFGVTGTNVGVGYSFSAELKSMKSFSSEIICLENVSTGSGYQPSNISITADLIYKRRFAGQSGTLAGMLLRNTNAENYKFNVKRIESDYDPFFIRDVLNSNFIVDVNEIVSGTSLVFVRNAATGSIDFNAQAAYYGFSAFFSTNANSMTFNSNVSGLYNTTSTTNAVFALNVPGSARFTFNGNIYLTNNSGAGRPLMSVSSTTSNYIINANIHYTGSTTTTSTGISCTGGNIIFSGNVQGTYAGRFVTNTNGNVTIKNTYISSSANGMTLFNNTSTTTQGITSLLNSIVFVSSSTDLINGQYLRTNIMNSQIKNAGTASILSNSNANGSVQLHNSLLITSGSSTINITNTAPLVVSNTTSNTAVTASAIFGTITELTEANIL